MRAGEQGGQGEQQQQQRQRLGCTDAELERFRNDPRNQKIMARAKDLLEKTVLFAMIRRVVRRLALGI